MFRSSPVVLLFFFILAQHSQAQVDLIERSYFEAAKAKNASVAAARYAEEGYFYTKFTTYVNAVDSSRIYADTALFFIKRSQMLADTALFHVADKNNDARAYLISGRKKVLVADSVIREFYPMSALRSHHVFGRDASLHLSTSVMEFFNASLLLGSEQNGSDTVHNDFTVLSFADEVIRLEADETTFQMAANSFESELELLDASYTELDEKIASSTEQRDRFRYREQLEDVKMLMDYNLAKLESTSSRLGEIRQLLSQKHLSDVKDVEQPDNLEYFETAGTRVGEIKFDELVPDGLVYKIQLGYYPSDVDIENFHGLFPISGETVRPDLARFYAGLFYSYASASKGNTYVRQNAIANAFIVPFYNGEKISISTAVDREQRRGLK